jgi:hypothetical protein
MDAIERANRAKQEKDFQDGMNPDDAYFPEGEQSPGVGDTMPSVDPAPSKGSPFISSRSGNDQIRNGYRLDEE